MSVGLALALHVSAAVTTVGYARCQARHSVMAQDIAPVMLEWMTVTPAAFSGVSDKSDKSELPTREVVRLKEAERPQQIAVKEPEAAVIPAPSALPAAPDVSDKSDASDMSNVLVSKVASLPEADQATLPAYAGAEVAATEQPPTVSPMTSAATSSSDLPASVAGGPYPVALAEIRPRYPRSARMQGHEGRVVVWAVIDDTGHSGRLEVRESSGQPALDKAALDAVRSARFRPATHNGVPVAGEISLPFEFRLQ
ncbi:MAG: energy transducer TonB [bacterium]